METRQELKPVIAALRKGNASEAVVLAEQLISQYPQDPEFQLWKGAALESSGQFTAAITCLTATLDKCLTSKGLHDHLLPELHHALGIVYNSTDQSMLAAQHIEQAIKAGADNDRIYQAAVTAFLKTGNTESAREYGNKALLFRDNKTINSSRKRQVSASRPCDFDPENSKANIIAYSLFGNSAYYQECAVTNARIAQASFSDFTARFYCGPEIPEDIINELKRCKAQVVRMKKSGSSWEGLFWRFWAFDDPGVKVVLVRDVDSPLTARERVAVEDWLYNSDMPFHVMRDHLFHCTPMMAGMWGGFTGLLPNQKLNSTLWQKKSNIRYSDQLYLARHIWPAIRNASLAHDSHYSLGNTRDFPPWGRMYRGVHVGWAWPWDGKLGRPSS